MYGIQFGRIVNVVDDDVQPVMVDLSLSPIHGSARCVRSSLLIRRSCRFPEHSRLNVRDGKAGCGSVTPRGIREDPPRGNVKIPNPENEVRKIVGLNPARINFDSPLKSLRV